MTYLSDDQVKLLLKPIHPNRVLQLKGMSYVEGYDIRAELNRIFGFGRWSLSVTDQSLVCETEVKTNAGKPAWYVVYRSRVLLCVYTPDGTFLTAYDGSHVGESTHPVRGEAHGNALTNSETYALRRAAINLGDQFGLGLYAKGSLEPCVRWTLVRPVPEPADTEDVPQVAPEAQAEAPEDKPAPRRRTATVKDDYSPRSPELYTPQDHAELVRKVTDMESLRFTWKLAGNAGFLQSQIKVPVVSDTGEVTLGKEVILLQDYLYRRAEELEPAKSAGASAGDPGEDPGTGSGDQR